MKSIKNFIRAEEGASMAEYALLLGIIVLALVTAITAFGTKIGGAFDKTTSVLPN